MDIEWLKLLSDNEEQQQHWLSNGTHSLPLSSSSSWYTQKNQWICSLSRKWRRCFFLFRFSGILFIIYNCYKFVDLLEKARVISQQSLERSYHIFYQIMSGAINGLKGIFILLTNWHPTHTHTYTHIITLYPSINQPNKIFILHSLTNLLW